MRAFFCAILILIAVSAALAAYTLDTGFPTGGTAIGTNLNGGSSSIQYSMGPNGYGGANGGNAGATCSGNVTFQWIWSSQSTPPKTVVLKVTSMAGWTGSGGGAAQNGIQGPYQETSPPYPPGLPPYMGVSSSTKYIIVNDPGHSFSYAITPSSSCASGSAYVSINVAVMPVTVMHSGTIAYLDADHALAGQKVTSTIGASGLQLSNYNWTIQGMAAFAHSVDWGTGDPPSKHKWLFDSGPGTSSISNYYLTDALMFVNCSATVHAPDGSVIGTVTGEAALRVLVPDRYLDLSPGTTQFVGSALFPTMIRAGDPDDISGMTFTFRCTTPEEYLYFGSGTFALAQKCSIDRTQWVTGSPIPLTETSNGFKLDNSFPYTQTWPAWPAQTEADDGDSPGWGLRQDIVQTYDVSIEDDFRMFVIYRPPAYFGSTVEWIAAKVGWWSWHTSSYVPDDPEGDPAVGQIVDLPWTDFEWDGVYSNNE